MLSVIVVIGSLIGLAGMLVYVRDTLVGSAKPNRVSWLIWCVAPLTAFAAAWDAEVRWAALPTFVAGFGPLLVLGASFANRNAYWKLHPLDYVCGAFSFLALVLWAVTSDPSLAIVFSIMTSTLASVPTIIKEWRSPETEPIYAYLGGLVSGLSAFTAVTTWNLLSVAFPSYMVLISVILVAPLLRRRKSKKDEALQQGGLCQFATKIKTPKPTDIKTSLPVLRTPFDAMMGTARTTPTRATCPKLLLSNYRIRRAPNRRIFTTGSNRCMIVSWFPYLSPCASV